MEAVGGDGDGELEAAVETPPSCGEHPDQETHGTPQSADGRRDRCRDRGEDDGRAYRDDSLAAQQYGGDQPPGGQRHQQLFRGRR